MPSQEGRSQNGPPRQRQQRCFQREVVVQEARFESSGSQRLDRLTALLSEALARQLGQAQPPEPECSTAPLDYPLVVSPTTIAKSAVPTEEA
jgi:hypothetical protein